MPLPGSLPLIFGDPAGTTLTTLRARVRERADMPVAGFVADSATSLDAWINEGIQELYEKLVLNFGAEYVENTAIFAMDGGSDIPLPPDFYKLYGVDLSVGGRDRSLFPYNQAERNAVSETWRSWRSAPRYAVVGANLRILPAPAVGTTGTIRYAPQTSKLISPDDTVSFPNGWERRVVLYAAIQCLLKEEADVLRHVEQLDAMDRQIQDMKESRDLAFPRSLVDVDSVDPYGW